jgi:sigma-E factor negative regulatory protein RseC
MLETRAVIVRTDGWLALVQTSEATGCERCDGKGCGAGKLGRLFCSKPRQFQVENPTDAGVGDQVIISVAEGTILRGIGLAYMLPLLLMLAGALSGNIVAARPEQGDGYAAAGALLGLCAGFVLAKWISSRQSGRVFRASITRQTRD